MISISFLGPKRKILKFEIRNKTVLYFDDIWKDGVQIYPVDPKFMYSLRRSGNPMLNQLYNLIMESNTGENYEQYAACKDEDEIAAMIRLDCGMKGLQEIK